MRYKLLTILAAVTLIVLLPITAAQGADKGAAPVAHWRFDEGGGPTAYDDSANNNDGTLSATPAGINTAVGQMWTPQGKIGGALECDGTDDYVDLGASSSFQFNLTSQVTWSAWIKTTTTAQQTVITYGTSYNPRIAVNNDHIEWYFVSGGVNSSTGTLTDGNWHHIAVTVNNLQLQFYIDGVAKGTGTSVSGTTGNNPFIGKKACTGCSDVYFNGLIDDVKIYNYARTADQIMVDYNAGMATYSGAGTDPNEGNPPVGYWKFDENTGTTVYDRSGGGYNGSFVDSPAWTAGKYGSALNFDGSNDGVNISSSLPGVGDTFTVEVWIYPTAYPASGNPGYFLDRYFARPFRLKFNNDGTLSFSTRDASQVYAYSFLEGIPLNAWHHVAITFDGTNDVIRTYVNGRVKEYTGITYTPVEDSSNSPTIGKEAGAWYFPGKIDEVKIYNYARTQAQIAYDYNKGKPVAHYRFDEGGGSIAHNDYCIANSGKEPIGWWKFQSLAAEIGSAATVSLGGSLVGVTGITEPGTTSARTKIDFQGSASQAAPGSAAVQVSGVSWTTNQWAGYQVAFSYKATTGYPTHRTVLSNTASELTLNGGVTLDGTHTIYIKDRLYYNVSYSNANQMSWEIWFKPLDQPSNCRYFRDANDDIGIYPTGSGHLGFFIGTYSNLILDITDINIMDGNFHHIGLTYDNTTGAWKVFCDGVQKGSGTTSTGQLSSSGDLRIGTRSDAVAEWTSLDVDDIRVYDYLLTAEQVKENYKTTHGTLVGDTKFVDGKVGKALSFDGTGDYVECGSDSNLQITAGTLEAWIYPNTLSGSDGVVSYIGSYNNGYPGYAMGCRDNGLAFILGDTGYDEFFGKGTITVNNWYHIAATFDGSTMKGYINGVEIYSESQDRTVTFDAGDTARIGTFDNDNSHYFDGLIDDARIYNYARTAAQVMTDYNAGFSAHTGAQTGTADPWGGALPVGHWRMDENTGVLARDASGKSNNGTVNGNPQWTQGMKGPCLVFDGAGDYVDCGDPADGSLGMGTSNFSVSFWYKHSGTIQSGHDTIVGKKGGSWNDAGWLFRTPAAGSLTFHIGNGTAYDEFGASVSTASWHHVVGVRNGTTIYLYIDGRLNGSETNAIYDDNMDNATSLKIGYLGGWNYFAGHADDVRLYNYALTPAQVAWDYNRGKPVGYWRFDEASGVTCYDDSDNNNDGIATIGATGTQADIATARTNGATGKFGRCMSFDGTDDYVDCGDDSSLNLTSTDRISISAWIKPTAGTWSDDGYVVAKTNPSAISTNEFIWIGKSDKIVHFTIGAKQIDSNTALTQAKWYHIETTFDGTNMKIYIDSKLDKSDTTTETIGTFVNPVIGARWDTKPATLRHFTGLIDDVKIYNYARTADQIMQDYNQGLAAKLGD